MYSLVSCYVRFRVQTSSEQHKTLCRAKVSSADSCRQHSSYSPHRPIHWPPHTLVIRVFF